MPSVVTTLSRWVRDNIARVGLADPALRVYGALARVHPGSVIANARWRRRGAPDRLPIPPSNLIFLVAGSTDVSWFLRGGSLGAASITEALRAQHVEIEKLGAILDFGAGCGRVLRNWHSLPHTRICGTDYNPRLVEWCRLNLAFADVRVNHLSPPLELQDEEFDLVYSLSVFTHLTEEFQTSWLDELTRVLKPGGHLILSTNGERYAGRLNDAERRRFAAGQLVVKNNTKAPGTNTCSAYHPMSYVQGKLARRLELVDFRPEGAKGNPRQDLYVFRKPSRG